MNFIGGNEETPAFGDLTFFDDWSIWCENFLEVMGVKLNPRKGLPFPLLGAKYTLSGNTPIIKRRNITQPSIYGTQKVLSSVKEPFKFRMDVFNTAINNNSSIFRVVGKNMALGAFLDEFTKRGGTFLIISTAGYYEHCSLAEFGAYNQNPQHASQRLYLDFEWTPMIDNKESKRLNKFIETFRGV